MAQKLVDPLDWRTPIVDKDGRPTAEFQRKWQQQKAVNADVPTDATSMSKVLDYIGTTVGAFLVRGATLWGLLTPSTANKVLKDNGVGHAPSWDTLSNVIDASMGSTRGAMLWRGAAGWQPLIPVAANRLMVDNGIGADPSWGTLTSILDTIGNARGTILYRGASSWAVLAPSTAGYLLSTNGASADPSWIAPASYTLPTASTSVLGGVKIDGTTITINGSGVISSAGYTLPTASTSVLGGVKVDGSTITINGSGVISSAAGYTLPTASTSVLGGVKIDGTTITINGSGVISSTGGTGGSKVLPLVNGDVSPAGLITDAHGQCIGVPL